MNRLKQAGLLVLIIPLYLVAFTIVHEMGHTVLARLAGDPDSTFTLVRIDSGGQGYCLGCNTTDHDRLSPTGNLFVHLGGLLLTQAAAVGALILLRRTPAGSARSQLLASIALGYPFLDVPVQAIQGLLYDLEAQTWPTGVDLTDAMLLISGAMGMGQAALKTLLAVLSVGYLVLIVRAYRRVRAREKRS